MPAPALAIDGASLRLGGFRLHDLDLTLERGEILVLLGPNGAGKSASLELIAGFHRPASGRILIGGRDVTFEPPERRFVGFVVQDFGLFPHVSVAENVAFGARARSAAGRASPALAVRPLLRQFGIADLAERRPNDLSPGERQRVALARALASQPDLFLLDEPFSSLDARSRETLREELRTFLRDARAPAVFVSHDRTDAFALADRVAVMLDGRIVQSGTVSEVFHRPASLAVAEFVGVENILAGELRAGSDGLLCVAVGERLLRVAGAGAARAGPVSLCIRAENVVLVPAEAGAASRDPHANRFAGRITAASCLGPFTKLTVDCGFSLISYVTARTAADPAFAPGAAVTAEIAAEAVHLLAGSHK